MAARPGKALFREWRPYSSWLTSVFSGVGLWFAGLGVIQVAEPGSAFDVKTVAAGPAGSLECGMRSRISWMRRTLAALGLLAFHSGAAAVSEDEGPPAAYGPVPTERQLRWHEMEFYGFVHFTVNTFTDQEWGYGDESPEVFQPTDFDADQIVGVAREAGMRGLVLTAKHHDGFCLWPSQYTAHSVKASPWKGGRGDVVREIADACRRQGLRFGVYLSPWDRNHAEYGRAGYLSYYRNQLRELLTQYGEVFTVWFDGANGGDGHYGGARETRRIDNRTYYDWPRTWEMVRALQPMACMFSDAGPDFRWVGNERGIAGDPCWATLDLSRPDRHPGGTSEGLNSGERPGTAWVPAECDVSIRPGWFYHPKEDGQVKTPDQLLDLYYKSVGRGACLNLNIPPDRRGRIHENDVRSLREFGRRLAGTFADNLARAARLQASAARRGNPGFGPERMLDGDRNTYWSTPDEERTPEVTLVWDRPVSFQVIEVREHLPLGQRVEALSVDAWRDGDWSEIARATSIGNRRLVRLDRPIAAERVRLRITRSAACPALSEIGLYAER